MADVGSLIAHWGYPVVVVAVVLGNVGVPIPEETILTIAGFLVWEGRLAAGPTVAAGVIGAVAGDHLGYWLGRRLGRRAVERHAHTIVGNPKRLECMWAFVTRYGALAVFAARFVPGLRFLAGPLAGAAGLRPVPFLIGNVLGACVFVPIMVGLGYGLGYGFAEHVRRFEQMVAQVEHVLLLAAGVLATIFLVRWLARAIYYARTARPQPGGR